jgi:hypothetical protein
VADVYHTSVQRSLAASWKRSYLNFLWLKCTLFSSFLPSSLTQGHFSSGAPEMLCTATHYYAADFSSLSAVAASNISEGTMKSLNYLKLQVTSSSMS